MRRPWRRALTTALAWLAVGCGGDDPVQAGGGFPAPAPEGCLTDAAAGHHLFSCDGFDFDVEVPPQCLAEACGLVLDVHGFSMSGPMEDANTELARRGREAGYVVVQPSANPDPPLSSWDADGGDDPVVVGVVEAALRVWHLDPKRVHATGFSQGGGMTWRMLCRHADLFASVAPAALGAGCAFTDADRPSREIPVLFMHGRVDALVPFDTEAIPARDRVLAGWSMTGATVLSEDASHTRTRWTSAAGTPFEFIEHGYAITERCLVTDLGGHCFPGSADPGGLTGQACSFACPDAAEFTWGEAVMEFFLAHPAP